MSTEEIYVEAKENLRSIIAEYIEVAKDIEIDTDSIRGDIEDLLDEELREI